MAHPATFSASVPEDTSQHASTHYEYMVLTEGLTFRYNTSWTLRQDGTFAAIPAEWALLVGAVYSNGFEQRLYRHPSTKALILMALDRLKSVSVNISAMVAADAQFAMAQVRLALPERPPLSDKEEVNVSFWSLGANGSARALERTIAITPWAGVTNNYTASTRGSLDKLMVNFHPTKAGQLVLWYGPPGTGKTHALRALAWEWRKWCTFHYITDPETFFGSSANYMLDVLLLRTNTPYYDEDEDDEKAGKLAGWRLLILEDSGELMGMDAKAHTGQGLSRLLNVVDGLIGQGLRIMVLVTTNEVLKKLHPAVARAGRCAARIEFGEFKKEDAALWLAAHDAPAHDLLPVVSLADLYAKVGDAQTVNQIQPASVGFSG